MEDLERRGYGPMTSGDASLQVSKRVGWGSFRACNVGLQLTLQRCQLDGLLVLRWCELELDAIPK